MRFILVGLFGAALWYWEVGPVGIFGGMIMLTLGFLMQDVQSQSDKLATMQERLDELADAETEGALSVVQESVASLRGDFQTMNGLLNKSIADAQAITALAPRKPARPWDSSGSS